MAETPDTVATSSTPTPVTPAPLERLIALLAAAGATPVLPVDRAKTGVDIDATVDDASLLWVAAEIRRELFALECVLGTHKPPELHVIYLFCPFQSGPRIRLRATLADDEAKMPSLCGLFAGADWYEREIHDMYGVEFANHPHFRPLLLSDEMNFHPLRKDFHGAPVIVERYREEVAELDVQQALNLGKVSNERRDFFLNMGPQHPSTHGVLRILLHVEGERVLGARCHLGYSHRGTEKAAEKKQFVQFLPYTDRMDYLAPLNYNWGYAALLERATGIESPPRAQWIRIIMAELGRVASHLVWLGTFLLDLGAVTPFLYCFEDREQILSLFEKVAGQRMTTSYIVVGGVRNEVPADFAGDVVALVRKLRERLPEYWTLIMENEIFLQRTRRVGVMTADQCRAFGVTGPCLRGSGVPFDLRKDEPYCAEYAQLDWTVPTEQAGDCLARSIVRMKELEQSCNMIEQAAGLLPDGPTRAKIPRNLKVAEGEYYSATEGPRGVIGWYLLGDGSMTPYRLKIRVPSLANLQAVEPVLEGHRVADVVAILGSVDVVIPEIDR